MKALISTIIINFFLVNSYFSQVEQVVSGLSTSMTINQIKNGLQDLINKSLERADYSIAKASIQALGAIDAWKETNGDLLEKAFDELDEKSRNLFANASVLINQANQVGVNTLETSQQIIENANQITESITGSGKRSFILRYYPNVISPLVKDSVLITIRGVNLDRADVKVSLSNNKSIKTTALGPTEMRFWIPISEIHFDQNKHSTFEIKLNHKTRVGNRMIFWSKYENVDRTLLFGIPPMQVGNYTLDVTRSFNKEERRIHTQDMGKFEGTNETIQKVANPPNGYLWDLRDGISARSNFAIVSTGRGEAGRCREIIWNGSNEHGIIGSARCDEIRQVNPGGVRWDDGYKHCGIRGPIYRLIPTTEKLEPTNGFIKWGEDQIIELPIDVSSFTLMIKLYNGEVRLITNSFSDDIIEVIREKNRLIIRSKIPSDLN